MKTPLQKERIEWNFLQKISGPGSDLRWIKYWRKAFDEIATGECGSPGVGNRQIGRPRDGSTCPVCGEVGKMKTMTALAELVVVQMWKNIEKKINVILKDEFEQMDYAMLMATENKDPLAMGTVTREKAQLKLEAARTFLPSVSAVANKR